MPDGSPAVTIETSGAIDEIDAAAWDACAGAGNPFVSHAFLAALERSGSVTAETGWLPKHLTASIDGRIVACVPLYLKSHSYGEYVFDWAWAEGYERAGGRYYPKLLSAVPFTPVTGPRLLLRPAAPAEVARALGDAIIRLGERLGVSSAHVTFLPEAQVDALSAAGFLARVGHQYHWPNRGYGSFDDFLASLASRKRKAIRKERAAIAESGIRLRALTGREIEERHWDAFWRFYLDTVERKWAHAYLTRAFFLRLGEAMADRLLLVTAETTEGRVVGAALNLVGDEALYGRYWGCEASYRFLHFECCYYQAIDFAIARGLARVEAGAQGEHKLQRGYLPVATHSAHWLRQKGFRDAVVRFLAAERPHVQSTMAVLADHAPYRSDDG
jgi:predicted N-acyltransferase